MRLSSGYSDVDETGEAAKYAQRLDALAASPFWRGIKDQLSVLLTLQAGDRVLDVGCGTGDDVRDLARLVDPGGWAVGVDRSSGLIAEARRRHAGSGLPLEFHLADAATLDFADDSFDACRAERVLQHVPFPEGCVAEMVRVTRSGGRVAAVEPDYGSLVVDGSDAGLTTRILAARREHFVSGRIGGQLPGLFKRHRLDELLVQLRFLVVTQLSEAERLIIRKYATGAVAVGAISESEAERWLADLEQASTRERYRHAVAVFLVCGRKR